MELEEHKKVAMFLSKLNWRIYKDMEKYKTKVEMRNSPEYKIIKKILPKLRNELDNKIFRDGYKNPNMYFNEGFIS